MSIRFSCPSCKSIFTVAVEYAGKRTECRVCGQRIEVPAPQEPHTLLGEIVPTVEPFVPDSAPPTNTVSITCPSCGYRGDAPANFADRRATCPQCSQRFTPSSAGFQFAPEASSAVAVYQPPKRRFDEDDRDDEDYRPRRRRRRRRRYEDDDDYRPRCPYCETTARPYWRSQISVAGWIVLAMFLLFCWPLFWVGLLITEQYSVCSRCGGRIG
jgi:DNA-directed RNA polymerase subunit RPC12/RpoP